MVVSPKYPDLPLDFSFRPAPATTTEGVLSAAAIDQFNRVGYTPPLQVFSGAALQRIQHHFRHEHPSAYPPAGAFQAYHAVDSVLYSVVAADRTRRALQQLVGSPNVVCHISQFVEKLPSGGHDSTTSASRGGFGSSKDVYHQDAGFNAIDAGSVVGWVAIEDADESNGCMWCVPGSHLPGLARADQSHRVLQAPAATPVRLPAKAGQIIFISDLLWHSSPPNPHPSSKRPAVTATYAAAEQQPVLHAVPSPSRFSVVVAGIDAANNWCALPPPQPYCRPARLEGVEHRLARQKIVGHDHNAPDPFPGFGGTVGLGQDIASLSNGNWLCLFHAGYWHMSMASPFVVSNEQLTNWRSRGFPEKVANEASHGGRIMAVRSSDRGSTWSRPETVLNQNWDDSVAGCCVLPSTGRLLIFLNQQASWYGPVELPHDHNEFEHGVNTRIGCMYSDDNGASFSSPVYFDCPFPYYQRAYAAPVTLPSGALLYPCYASRGQDAQQNPIGALCGVFHRSDDDGANWRLWSTLERPDGQDLDEPSVVLLQDNRLLLITRPDAAIFYSNNEGVNWDFSHCAPFAPLKPSRLAVLTDGTVVCWMTANGKLSASFSCVSLVFHPTLCLNILNFTMYARIDTCVTVAVPG
jgi:ectoine hydroxylase-related dioxygenase (phytanoyl-CoA dioxygenase family)